MTYQTCLEKIHSRKTFSSTASLSRMERLMDALGNPQNRIKCVHVAGTNGKGSACALIESALRASGYRTGLYTSPYLLDFRERIRIDFQMISREELISCYELVMAEEERLEQAGYEPINEFELVTAIGFVAFARAGVDYAVIEVGLGGRCDATNVIKLPKVCCIMPVALDHTAVLGSTVAEIAAEKAGIIKANCPAVLAKQSLEALAVLHQTAMEKHSTVTDAEIPEITAIDRWGSTFRYQGVDISIPLLGAHQAENAAAAYEVCKRLNLPQEQVLRGFANVQWPGRMQYIPGPPGVLIDAGHNPAGIEVLTETLDQLFPDVPLITVMAMMRDKDYSACIPVIARRSQKLIGVSVGLPRALPPEELVAEAGKYCETETAVSVASAMEQVKKQAEPGQMVLVCGSVYAAGAALETIMQKKS